MKEKNAPAPHIEKEWIDNLIALSGLSYSDCQACGKQSNGLTDFYPFIGMKVVSEDGVKFLAPHYGAPVSLCYPCLKQAIKIEIRKSREAIRGF